MSNGVWRAAFWIFALFLAQNALQYLLADLAPPLVLPAVLFYALSRGASFGLGTGVFAGLLFEVFGVGKLGVHVGLFALIGYTAGALSSKIFRESFVAQIILPVLCHYAAAAAGLTLARVSAGEPVGVFALAEAFLPVQLAITAAASPPVFAFLKRVSRMREARPAVWR